MGENEKCSLLHVIDELVIDVMGDPESYKLLDVMQRYIDLYFIKFDKNYQEKR